MGAPSSSSPPARARMGGWLLTALFVIGAALVFYAIYLAFPAQSHYGALLIIGVLALLLALASYLAESFSRDPQAQRSLAWGFFGMGFTVLLLTLGLGPSYGITSPLAALEGLIVVFVLLAVTIALIVWRVRALAATQAREAPRQAWRNEPAPSAFSYAAANSPSVPSTAPPPADGPSPPPSGGP